MLQKNRPITTFKQQHELTMFLFQSQMLYDVTVFWSKIVESNANYIAEPGQLWLLIIY